MKLRVTKAWSITFEEFKGMITQGDSITVTTDYGITVTGTVHNILSNCIKLHIGTCSFASISFTDIRRIETEDTVFERIREEKNEKENTAGDC